MDPSLRRLLDDVIIPALEKEKDKVIKLMIANKDDESTNLVRLQGRVQGIAKAIHGLRTATGHSAIPGGIQ